MRSFAIVNLLNNIAFQQKFLRVFVFFISRSIIFILIIKIIDCEAVINLRGGSDELLVV